jgi:hypothetical protein
MPDHTHDTSDETALRVASCTQRALMTT